MRQLYCEK